MITKKNVNWTGQQGVALLFCSWHPFHAIDSWIGFCCQFPSGAESRCQ